MKVKRGAFQKKIICNSQSTRSRLDKLHVIDMEETGMATWPGGGGAHICMARRSYKAREDLMLDTGLHS